MGFEKRSSENIDSGEDRVNISHLQFIDDVDISA